MPISYPIPRSGGLSYPLSRAFNSRFWDVFNRGDYYRLWDPTRVANDEIPDLISGQGVPRTVGSFSAVTLNFPGSTGGRTQALDGTGSTFVLPGPPTWPTATAGRTFRWVGQYLNASELLAWPGVRSDLRWETRSVAGGRLEASFYIDNSSITVLAPPSTVVANDLVLLDVVVTPGSSGTDMEMFVNGASVGTQNEAALTWKDSPSGVLADTLYFRIPSLACGLMARPITLGEHQAFAQTLGVA